jgi:hypothetical protein
LLISISIEKKDESARWKCGNRAAISKGGGKRRETWFWFSSISTARHFHGAPRFSRASPLLLEAEKQRWLGGLHELGRFGVAMRVGNLVQGVKADGGLEVAPAWGQSLLQCSQSFPRRGVAFVDELLLPALVHDALRLTARTMEIQIRIEVGSVEGMDVFGVLLRDVAVAAGRRFADNRVSCTGTTLGRR